MPSSEIFKLKWLTPIIYVHQDTAGGTFKKNLAIVNHSEASIKHSNGQLTL